MTPGGWRCRLFPAVLAAQYLLGLRAAARTLWARVLAVADSYDAMTSRRGLAKVS